MSGAQLIYFNFTSESNCLSPGQTALVSAAPHSQTPGPARALALDQALSCGNELLFRFFFYQLIFLKGTHRPSRRCGLKTCGTAQKEWK